MQLEFRDAVFQTKRQELEYLGKTAKAMGYPAGVLLGVIVDADDSVWLNLANVINPGIDWQEIRDRGLVPIATALVLYESVIDDLCLDAPEISDIFINDLPSDILRILVLSHGVSAYYITLPQYRDC